MASGIWDQTLYNPIQESIHECLKFSVVRSFSEYLAKRKTQLTTQGITPTHVILERYDGMLNKHDKDIHLHQKHGSLSRRPPKALRWIQKKAHTSIAAADIFLSGPKKEKSEKSEKGSLGKNSKGSLTARGTKDTRAGSPDALQQQQYLQQQLEEGEEDGKDDKDVEGMALHKERITEMRLQQQIQLLRNLHQYQQDKRTRKETVEMNPWEFESSSSSPLSKSVSMPVITHRTHQR
jgi:hypothetical protein